MKTTKILSLALMFFVAFSACKKDEKPTIEESKAVIKTNLQVDSPEALGRTAIWPEIFYDLETNLASASKSGQIIFTGNFNLDLAITDTTNYKLGVFTDADKTLQTITYDYLKTADIDYTTKSFGYKADNSGWYGYNMTTHLPSPIIGKFAIVYKGSNLENAEKIYILKLNTVGYVIVDNVNKLYKGQSNFDYKIYTKK